MFLDFFQKVGVMILISSLVFSGFIVFLKEGSQLLDENFSKDQYCFQTLMGYDWKITTALLTSLKRTRNDASLV